jgi:hypothetical protein
MIYEKYYPPQLPKKRTQNEPKRTQSQKPQKCPQPLLFKGLIMEFTLFTAEKTNPKRTQFLSAVRVVDLHAIPVTDLSAVRVADLSIKK